MRSILRVKSAEEVLSTELLTCENAGKYLECFMINASRTIHELRQPAP